MTQKSEHYACALYELAEEEEACTEIAQQLDVLEKVFSDLPELGRLLCAANISREERCRVIHRALHGKVHPYVLHLLKLLTQKGEAESFMDCCKAYRRLFFAKQGMLPVCAVSAIPLGGEQLERLQNKLEALTGKKILLENRVDPTCLGGLRLDYDGKRIDGTVESRLKSISTLLRNVP